MRDVDADLLVLPEFFATGYQFISQDEVAGLSERIPGGQTTQSFLRYLPGKAVISLPGFLKKPPMLFIIVRLSQDRRALWEYIEKPIYILKKNFISVPVIQALKFGTQR